MAKKEKNVDETAEKAKPMGGKSLYQIRAKEALPLLIEYARSGKTVIYADLAHRLKMDNPRNLNYVLGSVGTTLKMLSDIWGEEIPALTALVVQKGSALPGHGVDHFLPAGAAGKKLSAGDRKKDAKTALQAIFAYKKWPEVLQALNVGPATSVESPKKAFLLAWNPGQFEWEGLPKEIARIRKTGFATITWSCGNRKSLPKGSEIFMVRLGKHPKGLVGRGVAVSEIFYKSHWDPEKARKGITAPYIKVRLTDLAEVPIIPWSELQKAPLDQFKWSIFASGVELPETIVAELDRRWETDKPRVSVPTTDEELVYDDLTALRNDPAAAKLILDRIFESVSPENRRRWEAFLAESIEYADSKYTDRWVLALHRYYIRCNVGMMLCIQFHPDFGVTLLLEKKLIPKGLEKLVGKYKNSPGCQFVVIPFNEPSAWLDKIRDASHGAIDISGRGHRGTGAFRGAHSPGVVRYLEQVLGRELPNPSYFTVPAAGEEAKETTPASYTKFEAHPYAAEWAVDQSILDDPALSETDKEAVITARRGQGLFRAKVLQIEARCRVTGVDNPDYLIASHMKPWSESSNVERLSGNNGLMLAPHVDHLFDNGFISFTDNGDLLVSPQCPAEVLKAWGIDESTNVGPFRVEQRVFLDYHREHVFKS